MLTYYSPPWQKYASQVFKGKTLRALSLSWSRLPTRSGQNAPHWELPRFGRFAACLQYLALPSIRQNAHPLHPAKLFEKKFKTLPSVSLKNFLPCFLTSFVAHGAKNGDRIRLGFAVCHEFCYAKLCQLGTKR